jgi:hypothetical protein
MGILVSEGILPSGIPVSNVYMSFGSEIVYVSPKNPDDLYTINTYYKVYKDETKALNTDIRIPFSVEVNDMSVGIFHFLYEKLKGFYPNSTDVIEAAPEVVIPDIVAEIL